MEYDIHNVKIRREVRLQIQARHGLLDMIDRVAVGHRFYEARARAAARDTVRPQPRIYPVLVKGPSQVINNLHREAFPPQFIVGLHQKRG